MILFLTENTKVLLFKIFSHVGLHCDLVQPCLCIINMNIPESVSKCFSLYIVLGLGHHNHWCLEQLC